MADIGEILMIPVVSFIYIVMDNAFWPILQNIAGANAVWEMLFLVIGEIATIIGMINGARE